MSTEPNIALQRFLNYQKQVSKVSVYLINISLTQLLYLKEADVMLGSIRQPHRIHSNPSSRQRYTAQNNTTQNSGMFFAATQPEQKKVAESSHKHFLDMPPELLKNIGDFLGSKEVLNCMLPLSRKTFQIILNKNFKLRIRAQKDSIFLGVRWGDIIEIDYRGFLSDKILEVEDRLIRTQHLKYRAMNQIPLYDTCNVMLAISVVTEVISLIIVLLAVFSVPIPLPALLEQKSPEQKALLWALLNIVGMFMLVVPMTIYPEAEKMEEEKKRIEYSVAHHAATFANLNKHLHEIERLYKRICHKHNKQLSKC